MCTIVELETSTQWSLSTLGALCPFWQNLFSSLPPISINKRDEAWTASACLPLISKVMTSIGLTSQLYRNSKMIFMVQMSKEFLLIPFLNQKDVITLHTIWWPQLHSTFNQPQVSPIYFLIFLWSSASFSFILSLFKTNNTHFATNIWKNVRNHNLQVAGLLL